MSDSELIKYLKEKEIRDRKESKKTLSKFDKEFLIGAGMVFFAGAGL